MENKSIKNRLYQVLGNKSPKHPFLLEDTTNHQGPTLKPKKMQDLSTSNNGKTSPIYKQGKMLLHAKPGLEFPRKKPS